MGKKIYLGYVSSTSRLGENEDEIDDLDRVEINIGSVNVSSCESSIEQEKYANECGVKASGFHG